MFVVYILNWMTFFVLGQTEGKNWKKKTADQSVNLEEKKQEAPSTIVYFFLP